MLNSIQEQINLGNWEAAKEILTDYKQNLDKKDYTSTIFIMDATICMNEKNYDEANKLIQEGLQIDTDNYELYFLLGLIKESEGNIEQALFSLENAVYFCKDNDDKNFILDYLSKFKERNDQLPGKVAVVIVSYKNLEYTKICVDSIRAYNMRGTYEIIVVDNASNDGTVEWLVSQSDIKFIINDKNLGFPAACNQGIKLAEENSDIFLLNNDTVVMQNSIYCLRMGLYEEEMRGMSGAVSNSVSNNQRIEESYSTLDEYFDYSEKNNIYDILRQEYRIKLIGFAILMKRSALKRVGLLDENFGLGHYEDDDLSVRFLSYGYLLVLCHDSFIYHFGNRSFAMKKAENLQKHQEMIENNRKYFIDKWGFDLNDYIMNKYDLKLMLSKVYHIDRRDEGLSAMEIKNLLTFDEYNFDNSNSNEQFVAGKNVLISENTKEIEDEKNTAMSTCAGVSIIIPTHNNIEFTKQCIESIRENTQYLTYQIIVVDNCSTDGTVEWLKEQNDLKVVLLDKYVGYTKSCNIGIELSAQNYDVMLLDNDTIVTPNWLIQLCQCLYSDELMGAVSPVTNQNTFNSYIEEQINTIDDIYNYAINHTSKNIGIWERRIHLVGYAMLIKREVLNKVGVLDERFYPAGNEDDDISFRILEAGYHLSLCKDTFIYHFNSKSMKRESLSEQNIVIENEHKFKEKWGFASRYSSFVRYEIIEKISICNTDLPIKVLEVGCACGATLLQIKNIYKNAELYGIELNDKAAKIANNFSEVLVGNVETLKLDYKELSFDYIIFADVLEHLNDPYSILTKFRKYLKKDGKIITSIPNIAHYSIIKDLINGNWTYRDAGILDRTHLRFFTLNEIDKMLKNSGYTNIDYSAVFSNINEENASFIEKITELSNNANIEQQLRVFQYIVVAASSES